MSKRLRMTSKVALNDALLGAWSRVFGHAFACAATVEGAPVLAVHGFRKSIRRCRAELRLVQHIIPRGAYQYLRRELRLLHRATSSLRDRDVVLDTLRRLPLAPEHMDAVSVRITQVAPVSPGQAATVLTDIAPRFEAIDRKMSKALRGKVRWRELEYGLRELYRRARRDMRDTSTGRSEEALHDWRKRTKELKYVVELLCDGGYEGEGRVLRTQLGRLNRKLGRVVDLMVLEDYVHEYLDVSEQSVLLPIIEAEGARDREMAMTLGRELFGHKSKVFARGLIQSSKQRHKR